MICDSGMLRVIQLLKSPYLKGSVFDWEKPGNVAALHTANAATHFHIATVNFPIIIVFSASYL
jgi:hypothetical protein